MVFFFLSPSEPDSPPVNITVVDTSPSTTTLTWSAPEKANGVIQYYEVLYENDSFSALVNTSTNRIALMDLRPFSHYNVSVRAYTRYGHGNQTSETLHLLSGEDGVYDGCTHLEKYKLKLFLIWLLKVHVLNSLSSPRQSSIWSLLRVAQSQWGERDLAASSAAQRSPYPLQPGAVEFNPQREPHDHDQLHPHHASEEVRTLPRYSAGAHARRTGKPQQRAAQHHHAGGRWEGRAAEGGGGLFALITSRLAERFEGHLIEPHSLFPLLTCTSAFQLTLMLLHHRCCRRVISAYNGVIAVNQFSFQGTILFQALTSGLALYICTCSDGPRSCLCHVMCHVTGKSLSHCPCQLQEHHLSFSMPESCLIMRLSCHGNHQPKPIQTSSTTLSEFGELFTLLSRPSLNQQRKSKCNATWVVVLSFRNETTELWQNVTETSVVIKVDSQSRYNASVSSWTRLGDGGVLIYISFTTTFAG